MIRGKIAISDYNEFEEEVKEILGHFTMLYGLDYDLYQLYRTFRETEVHLINEAVRYAEKFDKEDEEVRHSIILGDPDHAIRYTPPVDKLRKSYFIMVHSIASDVLDEVFSLSRQYQLSNINRIDYGSLKEIDTSFPVERAVLKHDVIAWYNQVRNKIVHPKIERENEYSNLVKNRGSEQEWLKIDQVGNRIQIEITDMEFGYGYANRIRLFLNDVIDESYRGRKKI